MTCAKKVEPLLPQSGSLDGDHRQLIQLTNNGSSDFIPIREQ